MTAESNELLRPGYPWSIHVVADASAVLQDLRWSARNGEAGGILAFLAALDALAMPVDMVRQVEARIERVATNSAMATAMRSTWERSFLTRLLIVQDEYLPGSCPYLEARDPTDLPLLAALHASRRAVVLTADHDLIDAGLAPASWLEAARQVQRILYTDGMVNVAVIGSGALAQLAWALLQSATAGSGRSQLLVAAMTLAAGWCLTRPTYRRRLSTHLGRALTAGGDLLAERAAHLQALTVATPPEIPAG